MDVGSPIEISRIRAENFESKLRQMRGYTKTTSIIWLRVLRIPTLTGVVIPAWSSAAKTALEKLCSRQKSQDILIRFDQYEQRWTNRRGGYIIAASRVEGIVNELQREQTLVLCLEPASPYSDVYSLSAITDPDQQRITVEVVGPGFDASDILRGDTQPHERFEIHYEAVGDANFISLDAIRTERVFLVSPPAYLSSVNARLRKIARRLDNPMLPPKAVRDGEDLHAFRAKAETYLKRSRRKLLLEHESSYSPMPRSMLNTFLRYVIQASNGLAVRGIKLGPTSFSASFLTATRIVFWDFFPARIDEMKQLYG